MSRLGGWRGPAIAVVVVLSLAGCGRASPRAPAVRHAPVVNDAMGGAAITAMPVEQDMVAQRAAAARSAARAERAARAARAAAARRRAAARAAWIAAHATPPPAPAPPAQPSGSPQAIAAAMLPAYGWSGGTQFGCLEQLWDRESGWQVTAENPTTGAYGVPQALPASKMASAGPDWQTDAATQIRWGLGYIQATYGSPCGAWASEVTRGYY